MPVDCVSFFPEKEAKKQNPIMKEERNF